MKYLYNKGKIRRGDRERHQFAFFAIGAFAVLVAVFVIGLQVGRVVEKNGAPPEAKDARSGSPAEGGRQPAQAGPADIRKELGAFSEDATRVPVVPPPRAASSVNEVEKGLTFQDTLARKNAEPATLVRSAPADDAPAAGRRAGSPSVKGGPAEGGKTAPSGAGAGPKFLVQAGAFRDRAVAEACVRRLSKVGHAAKIAKGTGKNREPLFRVLVGPFADKGAARKAVRRLKSEMKIDAFLLAG